MNKVADHYLTLLARLLLIITLSCSAAWANEQNTLPKLTANEVPETSVSAEIKPRVSDASTTTVKNLATETVPETAAEINNTNTTDVATLVAGTTATTATTATAVPLNIISGKTLASAPTAPKINTSANLMSLVFGLIAILVLIFGLAWLVKRMGQGGLLGHNQMKIVAAMPLGTRERLLVVDVAGQQLLLGLTATQINTLHVFPEPVIDVAQGAGQSDFGKKLMAILQKTNDPQSVTETKP